MNITDLLDSFRTPASKTPVSITSRSAKRNRSVTHIVEFLKPTAHKKADKNRRMSAWKAFKPSSFAGTKQKPPKADMSPANWHRAQRAAHKKAYQKQLRTMLHQRYECPVCGAQLQKFDWCAEHRCWSVARGKA